MLEAEGADFKEIDTHNILADEIMREELKEYSDWPTFPQVYFPGSNFIFRTDTRTFIKCFYWFITFFSGISPR